MFEIIWHFIDISIDWRVKLVVAALVVGVLLAFFHAYWRYILAGAAVVGGAILLNRAKQDGYAQRKADEDVAARKAEAVVDTEKDKVRADTDAQLDKEIDQWSKH